VGAGVLAGALGVLGLALAPSAGAVADVTTDRAAGATRYGTAAAVATEAYPDGSDTVVLATGENFPDALAASGLAGDLDAPVLLTTGDALSEEASAAIDDLGATDVTIVGGTAAVSDDVQNELEDMGLTVDRVAGETRYETAGEVADAIGDFDTAVVASGEVAADALSAGPIAADGPAPILLVTTDDVPDATAGALDGVANVIIVGGTARISDATADEVEADSADTDAERVAGTNRQETAGAIADWEVDNLGWAPSTVLLAAPRSPSSDFSPDALVAGPLGGVDNAPILIVDDADNLGAAATGFITDHADDIEEIIAVGGTAVISDDTITDAATAATPAGPVAGAAVTAAPELVSASLFRTLTDGSGTIDVRFTFDAALDDDCGTPDAGEFQLDDVFGTEDTNTEGTDAAFDPDDPNSVIVRFDNAETYWAASNSVSVGSGQVASDVDESGDCTGDTYNPTGDVGTHAVSYDAGQRLTPDLVDVSNLRIANNADDGMHIEADFTFDQPVYDVCPGYGILVTSAPSDPNLSWPYSRIESSDCVGEDGDTVITFTFDENLAGDDLEDEDEAQAIIDTTVAGEAGDSVYDSDSNDGYLTSVNVGGDGTLFTTDSPDVTSVEVTPAEDPDTDPDTVEFFFDEDVVLGDAADNDGPDDNFALQYRDGDQLWSDTGSVSQGDDNSIVVEFPAGSLDGAVRAIAGEGVAESVETGFWNYPGEAIIDSGMDYGIQGTDAPHLTAIARTILAGDDDANPFAPDRGGVIAYIFDKDIDEDSFTYTPGPGGISLINQTLFAVYDEDGNQTYFDGLAQLFADGSFCLTDQDHGQGKNIIVCTTGEGSDVTPAPHFAAMADAVSGGVDDSFFYTDGADDTYIALSYNHNEYETVFDL
jgi:putative cell wall-binding protein